MLMKAFSGKEKDGRRRPCLNLGFDVVTVIIDGDKGFFRSATNGAGAIRIGDNDRSADSATILLNFFSHGFYSSHV
jgi:hypothetical protein